MRLMMRAAVLMVSGLLVSGLAIAESRIDRDLDLSPGGRIVLDTDVGEVTVTGRDESGAEIRIRSNRDLDEEFRFKVIETSDGYRITLDKRHDGWWKSWRGRVDIELTVPTRTQVDVSTSGGDVTLTATVGEARLHTSGGDVRAEGIEGDVDISTSGGSIDVRDVIGTVDARTSGGSIEALRVSGGFAADTSGGSIVLARIGGDVEAETSGGRIAIEEAGGLVDAHTSGGRVSVGFVRGNDRGGRISSSGGGVTVFLDPGVGLSIDASSSGGSVRSDCPGSVSGRISRASLRGELNGGGETLRLRSSGGGVTLREI